mmetsp:Transcript_38796/g.121608  ORF Transcript_38796/g.121608 Transcript_38796/m.121608 type:complete len:248 (-) Transcript_38796:1516-2259(-)
MRIMLVASPKSPSPLPGARRLLDDFHATARRRMRCTPFTERCSSPIWVASASSRRGFNASMTIISAPTMSTPTFWPYSMGAKSRRFSPLLYALRALRAAWAELSGGTKAMFAIFTLFMTFSKKCRGSSSAAAAVAFGKAQNTCPPSSMTRFTPAMTSSTAAGLSSATRNVHWFAFSVAFWRFTCTMLVQSKREDCVSTDGTGTSGTMTTLLARRRRTSRRSRDKSCSSSTMTKPKCPSFSRKSPLSS